LAAGSQPHDLVLALVHWKAEICRERRIEHSERMWEPDLPQKRDRCAAVRAPLTVAHCQRGPFAHAVGGQDRRATRRSSEEGGRRVRLVMLGEQDFLAWHAQV